MRTDKNKNKNELTDEDAIQKRIREMVFEESERENKELEKKLNDEANAEALHEITGVSKKKIAAITKKVRAGQLQENKRFGGDKKKTKKSYRKIYFILPLLMSLLGPLFLLISNIDIKFGSKEEATEVHKAIDESNMQLLRYLIVEKGYDINNNYKRQLVYNGPYFSDYYIYHAIREKNPVIALFLINNGALIAPDAKTRNYLTRTVEYNKYTELKQPMAEAMAKQAGEGSPVAQLLSKGYPYFRNDFKRAIVENDYEALKLFKQAQKGNFDNDWHYYGLKTAAFQNNPDMLDFFFQNWSKYTKESLTAAFHLMVGWGNKKAAQKILDEGASVNESHILPRFKNGKPSYYTGGGTKYTALEFVVMATNTEMASWLIGKGADINKGAILPLNIPFKQRRNRKFTQEHYNIVKLLIDNGASVNKRVHAQKRPLNNAKKLKKRGVKGPWLNKTIELLESNGAIE